MVIRAISRLLFQKQLDDGNDLPAGIHQQVKPFEEVFGKWFLHRPHLYHHKSGALSQQLLMWAGGLLIFYINLYLLSIFNHKSGKEF